MLFAESEKKIFGEILFDLANNTNITRSSPGSKTRALSESVSKKMGRIYRKFDKNMVQAFVDGANGRFLEFIAGMMGLERLGSTQAAVTSGDKIQRFFVDTGTFGDINSTLPITITSGSLVSTSPGGKGTVYQVPFNVILSASASEAFVPLESLRKGEDQNVGRGQLIYHNFSNYSDFINDSLRTTNAAEISNAKSVESDSNLRFRIVNQVVASESANQTAVRIAALSTPGVADITMLTFFRGVGSFDILIKSTTPTVSDGLIGAVREAVLNDTGHGIKVTIRKPKETGLSLVGTLTFRRVLPAGEEAAILEAAALNITDYTNSLDIGEEWIQNEAIERVMATSEEIKNLGTAANPFDSKFIYRESRLEDNKVRSNLIGDFQPDTDERLIVENINAGDTPILFKAAT